MPRKKKSSPRPARSSSASPEAAPEESAAESLFRATYGRDMTASERRSTVSTDHPVPLKEWMKNK